MLDTTLTSLSTAVSAVKIAISMETKHVGLWATNPDFWLISPEYDRITQLSKGRFLVRKASLRGIYDRERRCWLIPVRYATARLDRSGNYWVRRTDESFEEPFIPT